MTYYLAIDLGASSGRHILGWLEGGELRVEEIYRFPNALVRQGENLVWDIDALFGSVIEGMKRAKELNKIPVSVGIDTWGVDYALLDREGERVGPVYCYRDSRSSRAVPSVHGRVPFETLYGRTGIQFQPFNTIYQLADDAKTGRLSRASHFLMLPSYLHYLLTGNMVEEYTDATTTGLVNARSRTWDEELLSALGYPSIFSPLCEPCTRAGELKREIAERVGYTASVILPASHDTASAVLAAPTDGEPYLSSGTWSLLGIKRGSALTDECARIAQYSNEGSKGGFLFQRTIMGLWMIQSIRREQGGIPFATLSQMARGAHADKLIDVNEERFLAPANMCEEIDLAAGRRLDLPTRLRVVYESLASCYKTALCDLEALTITHSERLHVFGGGCRDALLNELTEKATGKKIVSGPVEATAIGNLLMQMTGTGEIKDIGAGREIVRASFSAENI